MKIIALMATYNEADIVQQSVSYMIAQGIPLIILDSSTDGSSEILSEFLGKGLLAIDKSPSGNFELEKILERLWEDVSKENPDWIVLCDADEFLEPPCKGMSLKEAIEFEAREGYNMIQFNNFEFLLTRLDQHSRETDVRRRLRYYTWYDDMRFNAFKFYPGTKIGEGGGHFPTFPLDIEVKISPNKFILRHYRFRSYEQGLKKVFDERLPRYSQEEVSKGWHTHYKNFKRTQEYFVVDSKNLTRYDEDGRWNLTRKFDPYFGAFSVDTPQSEAIVLRRKLAERTAAYDKANQDLKTAQTEMDAIKSSFGYKLMKFYSRLIDGLLSR